MHRKTDDLDIEPDLGAVDSRSALPESCLSARPGPSIEEILSLVADGVISTDEDGIVILFNKAAEEIFGYPADEVIGREIEMLLPMERRDRHRHEVKMFGTASDDASRSMAHSREVTGLKRDGTEIPMEASLSRRILDGRKILTVVVRDISERKAREEQRRLLASEMSHRFKNMMAVVNSIVSLTARGATSVDSFRETLQGRLRAVARTQEALVVDSWRGAKLGTLLETELSPYRSSANSNVTLSGPEVLVSARNAASLTLAFHELATNAAKYGALSRPGGRLEVRWTIGGAEGSDLIVEWIERGGPPVTAPHRRGFGSDLMERCLGSANVATSYDPRGLEVKIRLSP